MLPALLMILSVARCQRIRFDPDAYKANHYEQAIINEHGHVIECFEEKFSDFACMHKTKWEELRILLQNSDIPEADKKRLLQALPHVK